MPLFVGVGAAAQPTGGWLVYGNDLARSSATGTSLPPLSLRPAWYTPVSGRISSQALVAQDMPVPGRRTVYFATSKGVVYALAENGYVRWRVELGQLDRVCQQIDGYGVTGTPAIDRDTSALYVADAFGRLHALDLATGQERPGWPVRVYADFRRELVWGALTIVDGSVYFGTGSYCDRKMEGKVFRVGLETGAVSRWISVPFALGGGGGVWGWGGIAYSAGRDSLFVATGNAFRGGSNKGKRFREWAGYGEQLVELSRSLSVRAADHPEDVKEPLDLDFVGSPVLIPHPRCGELAGVLNKDGSLYVWRTARVSAGPLFSLRLARPTLAAPLLSQLAYSPRTGALYVSTPSKLVRVDIDGRCHGRVKWSRPVGNGLLNGSPTVAGDTVWLTENSTEGSALLGFNARTGVPRFRSPLAGPAFVAPTVVGDRLYLGTYTGGVQGFAVASGFGRQVGTDESLTARAPELRRRAARLGEPRRRRLRDGGRRAVLAVALSAKRRSGRAGLGANRDARARRTRLEMWVPNGSALDGGRRNDLASDGRSGRERIRRRLGDALVVAGRAALPRRRLATGPGRAAGEERRPPARGDRRRRRSPRRRRCPGLAPRRGPRTRPLAATTARAREARASPAPAAGRR